MPPKVRITRDAITSAALELVRESGDDALNARALAARMGASTQPIFSNFASMDEVRVSVIEAAGKLNYEYWQEDMQSGKYPAYKASGMAYIRFAREEPNLFKLLYMRDRTGERQDELGIFSNVINIIKESTGISEDNAKRLHLEMWIFVHGVGVMLATSHMVLDEELISSMISDVYQGLVEKFKNNVTRG